MIERNGNIVWVRFSVILTMGLLGAYLSTLLDAQPFGWSLYIVRAAGIVTGVYLGGYLIDVVEALLKKQKASPKGASGSLSASERAIAKTTKQKPKTENLVGIIESQDEPKK